MLDRITRCIGENVEERNAEGTRKGRRRDHTRGRKVRHDPICMYTLIKKMQSCTEMLQPTHRVSNKMIDAGFLNNIETALVGGGSIYFTTPYQLTTNPTVNSGSTTTLTCTGVGGVPSGALAVLLGIGIFANTAGGYVQGAPHGGTFGDYWGLTGPIASQYTVGGMVIAPLDSTGKIDVKANGSSIVLQSWYIYGYVL